MPHRTHITWAPWVNDISDQEPCLGRIVKEAAVAREAAEKAGARTGSPRCRKAFESAEKILDAIRLGRLRPNTAAARKSASEALEKFIKALDCTAAAPARRGARGGRVRRRG
ncbi:MAG: hypothetical protein HY905_07205 [Deltaproteobacteria bacterium]|nr:hypothetical protein [Deltaproteobacteria bacterium]